MKICTNLHQPAILKPLKNFFTSLATTPMTLKEQIQTDMIAAMKAGDATTTGALRMLKSAILAFETSGTEKKVATDDDVIQIIGKEKKKRQDAFEQFTAGGRAELAAQEAAEAKILERYLPAQLSEGDVTAIVKDVIAATGATGKSDLGKVMGALMPKVKGRADGGMVNKIVMGLLVNAAEKK